MGLETRRNADGTLSRVWWGRYMLNGLRPCIKLCAMRGRAPASWKAETKEWPINDQGDELFESSRQEAKRLLAVKKAEAKQLQAMSPEAAVVQTLSTKQGKKYKIRRINDLEAVFNESETVTIRGEQKDNYYTNWERSVIPTFTHWWQTAKHSGSDPVTTVTKEDATAFVEALSGVQEDGRKRCADTINRRIKIIRAVFRKALPPGSKNPFDEIRVSRTEGDETIHREPLTSLEDIELLLKTAQKTDTLTYYLATVGVYTALRKGDICELRWEDINLNEQWVDDKGQKRYGTIDRRLNKTKVHIHIPMFPPLKNLMDQIFTERTGDSPYVFPEAAKLYTESRMSRKDLSDDGQDTHCGNDRLTDNLKYVYALAFAERMGFMAIDSETEVLELKGILDEVKAKVIAKGVSESRKSRIFSELDAYAAGKSFNEIAAELHIHKSQIHYDMNFAETAISPKKFIRNRTNLGPTKHQLIKAVTRKERQIGAHAASIYDFHALRTTFVTVARSAGMSLDDIRCFTGHTDTKMLEQFYDRTRGIAIAKQFTKAAPEFFRPDEKMITVTEVASELPGPTVPALPESADTAAMQKFAKSLDPAKRKELLKKTMLLQQALIDAE